MEKNKFLEVIHGAKPDDKMFLIKLSEIGEMSTQHTVQHGFTAIELIGALAHVQHVVITESSDNKCKCK